MSKNMAHIRRAGLLMPVFSLPSDYGIGDLGPGAYEFVRLLGRIGHRMWQVLPHGPTGFSNSPYMSFSAYAGNPYFISPDLLRKDGLLTAGQTDSARRAPGPIDYGALFNTRFKLLRTAHAAWQLRGGQTQPNFKNFEQQNASWLPDYCLYMACKEKFNSGPWTDWPADIKNRRPSTVVQYQRNLATDVAFWKFVQYVYFKQWHELKDYAHLYGVQIIGDMPFYVQNDSADVWAHREIFQINPISGNVEISAGVPGDDFDARARNWGMPCYNWQRTQRACLSWHIGRFRHNASLYDVVRMDHAIGYIRYYGISDTKHCWYNTPNAVRHNLLPEMNRIAHASNTEIVAEDLGTITRYAYDLFAKLGWGGIRVLQFALANRNRPGDIHAPKNYSADMLACTGTHDNMTLRQFLNQRQMPSDSATLRSFMSQIYASSADRVILPVPDVLELGAEGRICHSRDVAASWRWRLDSINQITDEKQQWLRRLAMSNGRI